MTATALSHRLKMEDALFLYAEKETMPLHIGAVMVYEGCFTREEMLELLNERMHLLPVYRKKVVFPPFGIAHPTWEDDPAFDLDRHVEEVTLPPPGDDQVLSEVCGELYAPMLERDRPLWKAWVIQGRADGHTAVMWKVHHCLVDGIAGVDITRVMHDLAPDVERPAVPPAPWQPEPMPDMITQIQDAVRDRLTEAALRWTDAAFTFMRPTEMVQRTMMFGSMLTSGLPALLQPRMPAPFDGPLSKQRTFAWVEFPFASVRAVGKALGATVNDVVLAVVSGGIGRWLRAHGHRTEGVTLRAMCPVNMQPEDAREELGNYVSEYVAPLCVGILDPVERLTAERTAMEQLKNRRQAAGIYALVQSTGALPPRLAWLASQLGITTSLLVNTVNTVSTNVPGPQVPLYSGGRKLLAWYGLGPLSANIGLFNAILTYNQKMAFTVTVDPKLVPDPWFYAGCLKESFDELLTAATRAATGDVAQGQHGNGREAERRRKKEAAAGR